MHASATGHKKRPRWVVPLAAAGAVLLVGVGTVVAVTSAGGQTPVPSASEPPTEVVIDRGKLYAAASFSEWGVSQDSDTGTQFSADRDEAHESSSSLRVDSSTGAAGPHRGLSQVVAVTPETTLNFSAWIQSPASSKTSLPVEFIMGSEDPQQFAFPAGEPAWTEVNWSFTTEAGQTELPITIEPGGPVVGFIIDQIQVSVAGAEPTAIPNGSFEDYASPHAILNDSLVFETGEGGLDIGWFTDAVDWSIVDVNDVAVTSGTLPMVGGKGTISVADPPQGFYKATISATGDPANTVSSAFILLDPAATGSPSSDVRFGVGAHIGAEYYVGSEIGAEALGLRGLRTDVYWDAAETAEGQYASPWTYDAYFPAIESAGLSVLPISNGANPLYDDGKVPTSDEGVQAYANFTAALVENYSSPAVEIFNELNHSRFNDGPCGVGAECYLPILRASYEAVKSSHPETLILGPANALQDDPYLTELYKLGGLDYLDVVTYHPYVAPEDLGADLQQAQARIKEYNNGQSKPIWLTEVGTPSNHGEVSEREQASFLISVETTALSNGVEKVFWYDLVNDSTDPADHEGNFGLFRRTTETNRAFEPKPSAMAQGLLIRKLAGKELTLNEPLTDSVFSYKYGSGDSATRVAWATAPTIIAYPSTEALTVTTATGTITSVKAVDGVVSIDLSTEPVFVDGMAGTPTITMAAG